MMMPRMRIGGGVFTQNPHRRIDRMSRMLRAKYSADVAGERRTDDHERYTV